jgi:hypothetical protein
MDGREPGDAIDAGDDGGAGAIDAQERMLPVRVIGPAVGDVDAGAVVVVVVMIVVVMVVRVLVVMRIVVVVVVFVVVVVVGLGPVEVDVGVLAAGVMMTPVGRAGHADPGDEAGRHERREADEPTHSATVYGRGPRMDGASPAQQPGED